MVNIKTGAATRRRQHRHHRHRRQPRVHAGRQEPGLSAVCRVDLTKFFVPAGKCGTSGGLEQETYPIRKGTGTSLQPIIDSPIIYKLTHFSSFLAINIQKYVDDEIGVQ